MVRLLPCVTKLRSRRHRGRSGASAAPQNTWSKSTWPETTIKTVQGTMVLNCALKVRVSRLLFAEYVVGARLARTWRWKGTQHPVTRWLATACTTLRGPIHFCTRSHHGTFGAQPHLNDTAMSPGTARSLNCQLTSSRQQGMHPQHRASRWSAHVDP